MRSTAPLVLLLLLACRSVRDEPAPVERPPAPVPEVQPTPPSRTPPSAPVPEGQPTPPSRTPPSAKGPANLDTCTSNADCVVSCEGDCCGAPCGCRLAKTKARAAEDERTFGQRCTPRPNCPAMGCAYEPAMSAWCNEGRCVASDGLGEGPAVVARPPPPKPTACTGTSRSTLPGVRIAFDRQSCTFHVADVAQGIDLRYAIHVEREDELIPDRTPNGCGTPGPSGLVTLEKLSGKGGTYCICDTGRCVPQNEIRTLRRGVFPQVFHWTGRAWNGPSDTNVPLGAPLPPGSYVLEVRSTGTYAGTPFEVVASMPVVLLP